MNQRWWRDLNKGRLFLALILAPILPVILGEALLTVLFAGGNFVVLGGVLAAAEIWSLLAGTVFLVWMRVRGILRRIDCLLLGVFLAFSLPGVILATDATVDAIFPPTSFSEQDDFLANSFHGPSDPILAVMLGVLMIPFGMVGGWVFWRVGVRPAPIRRIDIAAVFD